MINTNDTNKASESSYAPIVLITGGQGDLAKNISKNLRISGYNVLNPSKEDLDVSNRENIKNYFSKIKRIDVLINNAGITNNKVFIKDDIKNWYNTIEINLKGSFYCSKEASSLMIKKNIEGHILFISSFSAVNPTIGQSSYASSKAGILGLTKELAKELGNYQIKVNAILPGFLKTKMTSSLNERIIEKALDIHVLKKFNTTDEVSRFIKFIISSPNTSGQIFQLDSRI